MKTTKINIGIALSRNYDKISLEFLDEAITHETNEELTKKIREKFKMLRAEVEKEFGEEKPIETPKPKIEMASNKQKDYLESLGFGGDMDKISKIEATALIKSLLEKGEVDY